MSKLRRLSYNGVRYSGEGPTDQAGEYQIFDSKHLHKVNETNPVSQSDTDFITNVLMPYFGIQQLRIKTSNSKKAYPDIWVKLGELPVITVTREWARQNTAERRKRLVHEMLHFWGMEHNETIGYSSFPDNDTYSMKVYKEII